MEDEFDLKILSRNLRLLQERSGLSNKEIARRAKVADGTIGGILRCSHMPGIDKVAKIARAFGLNTYHLLMPDFDPDLLQSGKFDKFYSTYLKADDTGRRVLDTNAEYVARDDDGANDPNGPVNKKKGSGN